MTPRLIADDHEYYLLRIDTAEDYYNAASSSRFACFLYSGMASRGEKFRAAVVDRLIMGDHHSAAYIFCAGVECQQWGRALRRMSQVPPGEVVIDADCQVGPDLSAVAARFHQYVVSHSFRRTLLLVITEDEEVAEEVLGDFRRALTDGSSGSME